MDWQFTGNSEKALAARHCESSVGDAGHEHPPLVASKTPISTSGGAKSGARDAPNPIQDPDLAAVVKAWPGLPADIKAAIRTLIQTQRKGG
jgi:hypothetical protein